MKSLSLLTMLLTSLLSQKLVGSVVVGSEQDIAPVGGWSEPHFGARILLEDAGKAVLPASISRRHVTQEGLLMTARFEGFRAKTYEDAAGHCTIGYGHLIQYGACDDRVPGAFQVGLSNAEALVLLKQDVGRAELAVQMLASEAFTDGQFAAVTDFAFNCGTGILRKSGVIALINQGRLEEAAFKLRRYVKAGGKVLSSLAKRRDAEVALLFQGASQTKAVLPPLAEQDYLDILDP